MCACTITVYVAYDVCAILRMYMYILSKQDISGLLFPVIQFNLLQLFDIVAKHQSKGYHKSGLSIATHFLFFYDLYAIPVP